MTRLTVYRRLQILNLEGLSLDCLPTWAPKNRGIFKFLKIVNIRFRIESTIREDYIKRRRLHLVSGPGLQNRVNTKWVQGQNLCITEVSNARGRV